MSQQRSLRISERQGPLPAEQGQRAPMLQGLMDWDGPEPSHLLAVPSPRASHQRIALYLCLPTLRRNYFCLSYSGVTGTQRLHVMEQKYTNLSEGRTRWVARALQKHRQDTPSDILAPAYIRYFRIALYRPVSQTREMER